MLQTTFVFKKCYKLPNFHNRAGECFGDEQGNICLLLCMIHDLHCLSFQALISTHRTEQTTEPGVFEFNYNTRCLVTHIATANAVFIHSPSQAPTSSFSCRSIRLCVLLSRVNRQNSVSGRLAHQSAQWCMLVSVSYVYQQHDLEKGE